MNLLKTSFWETLNGPMRPLSRWTGRRIERPWPLFQELQKSPSQNSHINYGIQTGRTRNIMGNLITVLSVKPQNPSPMSFTATQKEQGRSMTGIYKNWQHNWKKWKHCKWSRKSLLIHTRFRLGLEYFDVDWYWMRLLHWAVQATPASPLRSKARNTWQRK